MIKNRFFYGGKHKGKSLQDSSVEANYLRFCLWQCEFGESADIELEKELRRRGEPLEDDSSNAAKREAGYYDNPTGKRSHTNKTPSVVNPGFIKSTAEDIINAGRQALAKRHHPDIGGDTAKMQEINIVADFLLEMVGKR